MTNILLKEGSGIKDAESVIKICKHLASKDFPETEKAKLKILIGDLEKSLPAPSQSIKPVAVGKAQGQNVAPLGRAG